MKRKKDGEGRADNKFNKGPSIPRGRVGIAIAIIGMTLVCMAYGGSMHDGPKPGDKTPV